MKLRAQNEGLGLSAIVATANLPVDTLVSITADRKVDKAGLNANVIGRLVKPAKTANGQGAVESKFKELIEIKGSGTLAAGAPVKLAAVDGSTGENVVVAWVSGTDGAERLFGVVWFGGASGAVLEVLTY
jgi:hypothetical protein